MSTAGQPLDVRARRPGRVLVAGTALAVVAGGAWVAARDGGGTPTGPVARAVPTGLAAVERRDLVDREDVDGTLEFVAPRRVPAPAGGVVTRLAPEGGTVRRGGSLVAVDGRSTAFVLYGTTPMYRDLGPGVDGGPDVEQLERNLRALGHDPDGAMTVDEHWSAATTAAVRRWQDDRDVPTDGRVRRTEVRFAAGPVRVGAHEVEVGDQVAPGAPLLGLSSTRRVVVARLEAGRQDDVDAGDRVDVELPGGRTARGVVQRVGRVATAGQDGAAATVALRVRLRGGAGRIRGLDRAPVTLSLAVSETPGALSVPVTALLARGDGRYAVELPGGRLVPVTVGAFADGWVQVEGAVRAGDRVVVPR